MSIHLVYLFCSLNCLVFLQAVKWGPEAFLRTTKKGNKMNIKKRAILVFFVSTIAAAGFSISAMANNGNGFELQKNNEGPEFGKFCEAFPLFCTAMPTGGGNGSGNEPPVNED